MRVYIVYPRTMCPRVSRDALLTLANPTTASSPLLTLVMIFCHSAVHVRYGFSHWNIYT